MYWEHLVNDKMGSYMKIWHKVAKEEYQEGHQAPDPEEGSSLDNLSGIYPDDIYSMDAERLYGDHVAYDNESLSIIRYAKGRPNAIVTIYRAVPDPNREIQKEIQKLHKILNYNYQYGFFPVGDKVIEQVENELPWADGVSYQDRREEIRKAVEDRATALEGQRVPQMRINAGDWVTLSKSYAQEHGRASLSNVFRIVQKTVSAKQLHTFGDSIHEWGYNP